MTLKMEFAGIMVYYTIIALSHIAFGVFSTKHRLKLPYVITAYGLFGAGFLGLGAY